MPVSSTKSHAQSAVSDRHLHSPPHTGDRARASKFSILPRSAASPPRIGPAVSTYATMVHNVRPHIRASMDYLRLPLCSLDARCRHRARRLGECSSRFVPPATHSSRTDTGRPRTTTVAPRACAVRYRPTFNVAGGGWYAIMERTNGFIKVRFWSRGSGNVPSNV